MALINENYLKLKAGYLFPEISRRVEKFSRENPDKKIIRMGIGDVTKPLVASVVRAFEEGVREMATAATFRGYGPEQGYAFLRELIAQWDYKNRGVEISADDIFISDGSKCDTGNILEIFADKNKIGICDPVYPVYVDSAVMGGRTGAAQENGYFDGLYYLPCGEESHFLPKIPEQKLDLVFLCFPNNPTGQTATREYLTQWVDYARENDCILLYDAAYEAFIRDEEIPHSIFEIPGAKSVAMEFRSFSKTAGFTGTRCAFTVVPQELEARNSQGEKYPIRPLWSRRQTTKFNGVSYPVQKAAAAVYSTEGRKEVTEVIDYYLENARIMKASLLRMGFTVYGGKNAPYIWLKTLKGMKSWEFFDLLLKEAGVVGTPGAGFGPAGEGFFRLSAFAERESVEEGLLRISKIR